MSKFKFKFKPNKKGESLTTNGQKADAGEEAIRNYPYRCSLYGADTSADITDLIADLGHFADREHVDFEEAVGSALLHWREER